MFEKKAYVLLLLFFALKINAAVERGPYLSWVNDPHTTITITWQTAVAESSILEYGVDTTNTDTIINPVIDTSHSIEVTNLEPSSKYYYRVRLDSQFHSFKTAATSSEPFTFCVFGDTRTDSVAHQSVVDRIVAIEPNFVLHTGDLVYNGYSLDDWNTFFNIEKNLMNSIPFMPSIGNHEVPSTIYLELFYLPGNEKWYSFNYSNAHFICLDTESDLTGTQLIWLEDDLLSANAKPEIDWIFVYFQKPPYSKGAWGSDTVIRNAWCNLFETYNVDMVFSGHNHFYQRTNIINDVIYIVTGGGGAPLYDPDTASWIAYSEKTYHCCKVDVNGLSLRMDAIKPDGTIFDSLITTISSCEEKKSTTTSLAACYQNYPNPFTQATTIKYYLSSKSKVSLKIYDITGRVIKTLANEEQEAGSYNVSFKTKDLTSGIYFAKLSAGGYNKTKKLTLVK